LPKEVSNDKNTILEQEMTPAGRLFYKKHQAESLHHNTRKETAGWKPATQYS